MGLDNAGKTTLLQKLKEGRVRVSAPTLHPNKEYLEVGRIQFTTYDLGGHESARKLWKDYFPEVDGIVYIVDANDRSDCRSKKELDELLSDDHLAGVPFWSWVTRSISQAAGESEPVFGSTYTSGKDTKDDGVRLLSSSCWCREVSWMCRWI